MTKAEKRFHKPDGEQSDPLLSIIINNVFDVVVVIDHDLRIALFNRRAEQVFGFMSEEVLGKKLEILLPAIHTLETLDSKIGDLRELEARRKDGGTFLVEASISPVDVRGNTLFAMILRDITAKKQIENELLESKERFRTAFEYSAIGMCLANLEGRFLVVNQAMCEIFGRSKEEFIGRHFNDITHPDDYGVGNEAVRRMIAGETKSVSIEKRYSKGNGQYFWANITSSLVRDSITGHPFHFIGQIRDITQQKETVQIIQRHQKTLELFIEHAPAAIAMFDKNMNYLAVSRRYLQAYGLENQNVLGRNHYELFPNLPERWVEAHRRGLGGSIVSHDEDPFPREGGKLDWVRWEIHPWYESERVIGGIILFSEVITERKMAQEALKNSEEKFSYLFGKTPVPAVLARLPDFRFVDVNDAWANLFGLTREECIGKTSIELGVNRETPQRVRLIGKIEARQSVRNWEQTLFKKSGQGITVLTNVDVITINGEDYALTTLQDISERKQSEMAMVRYNERLKNLHAIDQAILQAEKTPENIAVTAVRNICSLIGVRRAIFGSVDLERKEIEISLIDPDGKIIERSQKALTDDILIDLKRLGEGSLEIVEDNARLAVQSPIARMLDLEERGAFINLPFQTEASVIGFLNLSWDKPHAFTDEEIEIANEVSRQITIAIEQTRLRRELADHAADLEERVAERTEQLEESNKDLEAFAYSVSHDLRAPLRSIEGFSQILEDDYAGVLDDEGRRLLGVIRRSTSKMDLLITDLLALSRVSRVQINHNQIDMNALVHSVFDELADETLKNKIVLRVENLPVAPADPLLLRQVWANLIGNAIKYSAPKKKRRIEINGRQEGGLCKYTVRDNGVGFDPTYKDNLFRLFQRLHRESEFPGTGVGLAIVQRIIQRHGGQVWAEGQVDHGAAFHFSLPLKPKG